MSIAGWIHENLIARSRVRESDPLVEEALRFTPADARAALDHMLDHATRMVPHYRDLAAAHGGGPMPLDAFPILTKRFIQANFDRLTSDDHAGRGPYKYSTGGSTGEPLVILQDLEHKAWVRAGEDYIMRRLLGGLHRTRDPKIILWGSAADVRRSRRHWMKRLMLATSRTHLLNAFRMTPDIMRRYAAEYNRVKPVLVKAYAGSLYTFCRFVRDEGLRLDPPPKAIYTAAENLTAPMREVIEEVLRCRVTDVYGSREIGLAAAQCGRGVYHVLDYMNHFEILDADNRPAKPGCEGRIIVTTLRNHTMPLIRYEIGDYAVAADGPCDCGLDTPVFKAVRGRIVDHFVRADGTLVYGGYFTVPMFHRPWVEEFQFLQTDHDTVEIHVVQRSAPPPGEVEEIVAMSREIMGEGSRIVWKEVDHIPRTIHGKLLFTRSLLVGPEDREQTPRP